jgi:Double zinc ribbon
MLCPHCNSSYTDDYLFCLTDGNALLHESGEQETVIARVVTPSSFPELSSEPLVVCPACGLQNRANSKFCKKCGGVLAIAAAQPVNMPAAASPVTAWSPYAGQSSIANSLNSPGETIVFRPPVTSSGVTSTVLDRQKHILLIAAFVGVLIIGGALVFTLSGSNDKNAASNSGVKSPTPATVNAGNANITSSKSVAEIGKTGTLTTNQRIRSSSNKYSEILGVHYKDARIKVLDVESYTTEDGYTTWYRVHVLSNGCDAEGRLGCGNDLNGVPGDAATEGWMNSKYIILD